jgi:hypothetical protein
VPGALAKTKNPSRSISRHELHHQFAQLHSRSVKSLVQQFLRRGAVACHWFVFLDRGTPYPLSRQGFCGSLTARRNLRGVPPDGRAMGANHPARNPAKCLASYPRNGPAMARQWQQQCRRMAVEMTRKTTCPAPDLDAPLPRRKLARRLATWPRNSLQAARGNFAVSFNHDI